MSTEKQTNYTIAEGYELPSRGEIYDTPVNPKVELRSMTARDEMKRLAPSTTPLKVLADIIEGCLLEKPAIHVYDMATADYEFLLHKLRVVTYGDDYKIGLICPSCDNEVEVVSHLDELELQEFNLEEFEKYKTITTTDNRVIRIKFSTPRLMEEIESKAKELKRKFKDADFDFSTYATLATIIDTVDDSKMSSFELDNFINRLSARDMKKILNNYAKLNNSFGLKNELTVACPICGGDINTYFRFGPEFFGPSDI